MNPTPIRVLLVDDEVDFLEMLSLRLGAAGIVADTAGSGPEGLEKLGTGTYDVVILDLLMPGMDGIETLSEMRVRGFDLPVVVMTGHGPVEDQARAFELGAVDVLLKPADFHDILRQLHKAAGRI